MLTRKVKENEDVVGLAMIYGYVCNKQILKRNATFKTP